MNKFTGLALIGRDMAIFRRREADHVGKVVTVDGKPVHVAGTEEMARRIANLLNFCRTGKLSHLLLATKIFLRYERNPEFSIENQKATSNA
jgi:hypothetical protein